MIELTDAQAEELERIIELLGYPDEGEFYRAIVLNPKLKGIKHAKSSFKRCFTREEDGIRIIGYVFLLVYKSNGSLDRRIITRDGMSFPLGPETGGILYKE